MSQLLGILFLLFVSLPLYLITSLTGCGWLDPTAWRYRRIARSRNTYISQKMLRQNQQTPGTFFIDHPSPGMGLFYVWWTPDDVLSLAPAPPPPEDYYFQEGPTGGKQLNTYHPFDRWLWETYLNPETGKASKVAIWNLRISEAKLQRRFPRSKVLRSWTGVRMVLRLP